MEKLSRDSDLREVKSEKLKVKEQKLFDVNPPYPAQSHI
jgi:hypothetical protein